MTLGLYIINQNHIEGIWRGKVKGQLACLQIMERRSRQRKVNYSQLLADDSGDSEGTCNIFKYIQHNSYAG